MNDDRQTLLKALGFHGHRCWASVTGVRVELTALRELGVKRSGGRQLIKGWLGQRPSSAFTPTPTRP